MSIQSVQRLLDESRQSYDLHNHNAQLLSDKVANLNREVANINQRAQQESLNVTKPFEQDKHAFEQIEKTFFTARDFIDKARSKFISEHQREFQSAENKYNEATRVFEKAKSTFAEKQKELRDVEDKFSRVQQTYDAAYAKKNQGEQQLRATTDKIVSRVELEKRRVERELEHINRELETERRQAENARRDTDMFTRQLADLQKTTANDNHAPARQLYSRR